MLAVLRVEWVDVSVAELKKKNCNNFAIVPFHEEECFEKYHSLKHY
jgi:hypothetical protein